jgi:ATP-binding protein involved in chromosome partitioning
MFGVSVQPEVRNQKMIPPEVFGVQLNSMGLLLPEKTSTVWRGAMLAKALNQLLFTTAWTNRDVLFVDVPPGTGDVSLSLSEQCKIDGCVLVSTPQGLALLDVQKAADMCRKLEVPLWGVVENMSYIEHGDTRFCLFGEGNVENFALAESLPFLGRIPLVPELAKAADSGLIAASDITKYTAEIFQKISKNFSSKKI